MPFFKSVLWLDWVATVGFYGIEHGIQVLKFYIVVDGVARAENITPTRCDIAQQGLRALHHLVGCAIR